MAISASSWKPVDHIGLDQEIDATSTTQKYKEGYTVRCKDVSSNARGYGEFVYAKGVASTVAGDLCILESGFTTIRAAADDEGSLGVAMSANVASQWGWYQVRGRAIVSSGDVADNAQLYLTSTAGTVDDAAVAGDAIAGMRSAGADDTSQVLADLMYPSVTNE